MITIIISVYRIEKYLSKCLDSVIGQTYKDLEVIVVDDGSDDLCPQICDEYASKDSRIKVIHQENAGLSAARNEALDIATGDFIAFVDGDDYIESTMYERMLQSLIDNEADMVICDFQKISEDGKVLQVIHEKPWLGSGIGFIKEDGIQKNYVWNKLYRKDLFKDIRFPIGKHYEDIFVMHEVFTKANRVVTIPEIKYNYLIRGNGITNKKTMITVLDLCEAIIKRLVFLVNYQASFSAVHPFVIGFCENWSDLKNSSNKDPRVSDRLKTLHKDLRKILIKYIKNCSSLKKKIMYLLIYISPILFSKTHSLYARLFRDY